MKTNTWNKLVLTAACVPFLAACEGLTYSKENITPNRVQVQEDEYKDEVNLAEVDKAYIAERADHFRRYGGEEMDLTIFYDPASKANGAMMASQELSRVKTMFHDFGVTEVNGNILPVKHMGDQPKVLITYLSYSAHAPKDCDILSGLKENTKIDDNEDYKYGCTVESLKAKQIARPRDLMYPAGDGGNADARRVTATGNRYRSGEPNESLGGESASE